MAGEGFVTSLGLFAYVKAKEFFADNRPRQRVVAGAAN